MIETEYKYYSAYTVGREPRQSLETVTVVARPVPAQSPAPKVPPELNDFVTEETKNTEEKKELKERENEYNKNTIEGPCGMAGSRASRLV